MKFFDMTKAEQLQLLGDLYAMVNKRPADHIYLNVIRITRSCGSIGCILGWAATHPSLRKRLNIQYIAGDIYRGPELVWYDHVLKERCLSHFLFGLFREHDLELNWLGSSNALRRSPGELHKRVALLRLLIIGSLIDSDKIDRTFWSSSRHSGNTSNFITPELLSAVDLRPKPLGA